MPAAASSTPTRIARRATASGRRSAGMACSAEPAASAAAEVVVITIIRVCELRPPAMRPEKLAYRPWTGLTPARTAAAIPSGTLLIAPGWPTPDYRGVVGRGISYDRARRSGRASPPAGGAHPVGRA